MRLKFQKGDGVAIAAVAILALAVALAFVFPYSSGAAVQIYRNGELLHTMPLCRNGSYTICGEYTNVVTVCDGKVFVSSSDCPGQDCVHSAAINAVGRSIVCLPNAVEIRVVGGEDDVDFAVG